MQQIIFTTEAPKTTPDTSCIVRKATKAEINWKILKMCFKSSQNEKKNFWRLSNKYLHLLNASTNLHQLE